MLEKLELQDIFMRNSIHCLAKGFVAKINTDAY